MKTKLISSIIISLLLTTVVMASVGCSKKNTTTENNIKVEIEENETNNQDKIDQEEKKDESKDNNKDKVIEVETNISFVKNALDKSIEPEFSTPWATSFDGKYDVCVEGRGEDGIEEDIGKIYLKDNQSEEKWSFNIEDKGEQLSPKKVVWIDDKNVAVIVGFAYGTIAVGGDVYKLDIESGNLTKLYYTGDEKIHVVDMKNNGNKLEMELLVYEDDNYLESHIENKVIELN
ncbi:DUF4652 domain-containing protein [Clostridium grantii]|uniref:Lipoprotein n=1 Tax=Clostridium grantii DSM 8605 TaxID=1121316 RepID=A0A1M5TSS6_9CLOT|nr:DUF4652 domain-containing protein [Clostridium grantii]SHH53875.1 protein of unknown function [Clostridium grantii DSM 8605]